MCTAKTKLPFMYIILLPCLHNFISNSMWLQFFLCSQHHYRDLKGGRPAECWGSGTQSNATVLHYFCGTLGSPDCSIWMSAAQLTRRRQTMPKVSMTKWGMSSPKQTLGSQWFIGCLYTRWVVINRCLGIPSSLPGVVYTLVPPSGHVQLKRGRV